MNGLVRVLIVDDSAFMRKTITQILSRSPFIEVVGIAGDGEEALEKVQELHPDVVTLDLMMPGLDGLGFLDRQMTTNPLPVVVVSTVGDQHELVLRALEAGAVDFVHKPSLQGTDTVLGMGEELIDKVKLAATIRIYRVHPELLAKPVIDKTSEAGSRRGTGSVDAIVIGISTGGPQGLKYLIPQFAEDFPVPIAVVLHIPVGYTELFASKLDDISSLRVVEAREGALFRAGEVMIAPGGQHLTFRRNEDGDVVAHLDSRRAETLHIPSVDMLFESAAQIFHARTLGIVMTGMGSDGRQGAARIKAEGGMIFTEAEESCVVYGMPGSVVDAGLSDKSIPLSGMAEAILEVV